jgi:hypothetical protein
MVSRYSVGWFIIVANVLCNVAILHFSIHFLSNIAFAHHLVDLLPPVSAVVFYLLYRHVGEPKKVWDFIAIGTGVVILICGYGMVFYYSTLCNDAGDGFAAAVGGAFKCGLPAIIGSYIGMFGSFIYIITKMYQGKLTRLLLGILGAIFAVALNVAILLGS